MYITQLHVFYTGFVIHRVINFGHFVNPRWVKLLFDDQWNKYKNEWPIVLHFLIHLIIQECTTYEKSQESIVI